ncbi:cytochrome P450, partial [Crocosphaera sp. Alani8]|uniref:cytochrome P450 n=1 Tax=Crocosphaera sp. Alani8 TaxID=3038952 RepID=UPI00313DDB3B
VWPKFSQRVTPGFLRRYDWATVLFRLFDPLRSLKECTIMNQVSTEFVAYFKVAIAQRRENPQGDLLTELIHAQSKGERLSDGEIIHLCIMTFVAGEQTTIAALSNGILSLLNHPQQLALLRHNPELAASAAEEIFRYESPTQYVMRVANEAINIGGQAIAPGENVVLCLGAANRDPSQFPDPDRFDIERKNNRHLAFAAGRHFCIGVGLARLEVPIVLNALIQGLPKFSGSIQDPVWRENIVLRSLRSLPLRW